MLQACYAPPQVKFAIIPCVGASGPVEARLHASHWTRRAVGFRRLSLGAAAALAVARRFGCFFLVVLLNRPAVMRPHSLHKITHAYTCYAYFSGRSLNSRNPCLRAGILSGGHGLSLRRWLPGELPPKSCLQ